MPIVVPVIVPRMSTYSGPPPTEATTAIMFAFGSVLLLKVLFCVMVALIPIGAVAGWRFDKFSGAALLAVMYPTLAFCGWVVFLAVFHGMKWVLS